MRVHRRSFIGVTIVVLFCIPCLTFEQSRRSPQVPGGEILYRADFAEGRPGGMDLGPGWEVAGHPNGRRCLHGRGGGLARVQEGAWADFTLTLALHLVRGEVHLNLRAEDLRRYFIGVRPDGLNLSKQDGPGRFPKDLAIARQPVPGDRFVTLTVLSFRDRFEVRFDGETVLTSRDPEPLPPGRVEFEILEGGEAWIDGVIIAAPSPGVDMTTAGPPTMGRIERMSVQYLPKSAVVSQKSVAGTLPAIAPLTAIQKALRWSATGGPLGGLGYDVRMRPGTPEVMYVSDAWAGIFKSLDGGKTWSAANGTGSGAISVSVGLTGDAIPIFSLTVDPHNPDTIWVGTKDKRGIFKSVDGGKTWVKKENGIANISQGITFRGFTVDPRPRYSDTVYAAAEISSYAWTVSSKVLTGRSFDLTMGIVYKTIDGGNNWQEIWRGNNLARYVFVDPKDPQVIYISTGIFDREAANTDVLKKEPGGVGVVRSRDGGKTWRALGRRNGLNNLYVGSLFMHPRDPRILLAGTGNNSWLDDGGVYLTHDGGDHWDQTLEANATGGESITAVEFAISNPKIAYAGGNRAIYRSEDGGRRWQQRTPGQWSWGPPGIRAGWPIDLQVDPRDPDRLFANNYGGGNFLSEDGGRTWVDASHGYTGAQMRDSVVAHKAGKVWAAGRTGLFASTDNGKHWQGTNYPPANFLDWKVIALDPSDPEHVLAASHWDSAAVYERPGGGGAWRRNAVPISQVLLPAQGTQGVAVRALAFAPSNPGRVYAGTGGYSNSQSDYDLAGAGIFRSTDGGATWQLAFDTLAHVQAFAIHPSNADEVYAAASNDFGVLKSIDGGKSWHVVFRKDALSVAIHPKNPDVVFIGLESGGIARSTDGGGSWKSWMQGMDANASITRILFDPQNPDVMYAADCLSGVYRSVNGGSSWTHINFGLTNREVYALAITADGRTLFAGTEGAGVFRLEIPVGAIP